jgi:cytochrome c biogenesis protein CcmG, thiol:disulfide interchange protein DsbE
MARRSRTGDYATEVTRAFLRTGIRSAEREFHSGMKPNSIIRVAALVFLVAAAIAAPIHAEDRAVCAVCGPREGAGFEPVKATATYRGTTYYFCSLECKVEFLKNPAQFLVTDGGKPAPSFNLETFDGNDVSLASLRGKVVLLDFWATFCAPCIAALPHLQNLSSTYGSKGFEVVGLTVDDRPALVKKATQQAKVSYPILRSTPEVWNAYKVNALPALVLVGRDGNIIKRYGGEADQKAMIADIERALASAISGR